MGVVDARVDNGNNNARITHSDPPGRRCRHRGRAPLCDISIVGAGVCRAVVNIVRYEVLDRLYRGVELGELNVRSLAQVPEKSQPSLWWRLEMRDTDFVYFASDSRAKGRVELIEDTLCGCRLKSD